MYILKSKNGGAPNILLTDTDLFNKITSMLLSTHKDKQPLPIPESPASHSDAGAERIVWIVLIIGVILAIAVHL